MLDPRRLLRWVHVGRVTAVTAVFTAAAVRWRGADPTDTLVAALAFAGALAWTWGVVVLTELRRRAPGRPLAAAQAVVDLLLVTALVHVTGGGASQFTGLYILVIAVAALLLPVAWALGAAALGCALYGADAAILRPDAPWGLGLWLQQAVFAAVALGCTLISARLREAGAGGERLAAALARARVEAADILRNIRSGIMTVDAEGRLLYANPAAATLLGLDLSGRHGAPVLADVARVAPELADVLRRAAASGERTTRAEGRIVRPDAPPALIGVTTTVSDVPEPARRTPVRTLVGLGAGGTTGTAIFSDITDSKRLEALHLRAERLEAVSELGASLAHEIRNPLASIRSATESLARLATSAAAHGLDAEDAADVRTLAALTTRESDRVSALLGEFLDFARARVTRVERVCIASAAADAVRLAQAHPAAAQVQVVVVGDADRGTTVDGDPELLHRALSNLLLNAAQATPPGGRVRLEVQCPDDAELPGGLAFAHGAVAVHVSDDGPGIAPELLDRLFDPFFTTKAGGTGLGLAIVQRAVEAHRGVVLVESGCAPAPGAGNVGGARFTLLLPRAAADAEPALPAARPYLQTPLRPMRAVA